MKVDSHQHFWTYNEADYPWIGAGMERIRRDFFPEHLLPELKATGIDRVISVQARQSTGETEWLLELAAANEFIAGVVGWVPLVSPRVGEDLERFAGHPKLRGVRHILHDEPDANYMLREDFNRGVGLLKDFGLTYDILIFERHLPQTLRFVDRHPQQVFVVDHLAKPRIRAGELSPWRERMVDLARRENVYCKLSGMVTEADWNGWSEADLRPYLETALDAFGSGRLLFGSDWPVCLVASEYARWWETVRRFVETLSPSERSQILGLTAADVYGLV